MTPTAEKIAAFTGHRDCVYSLQADAVGSVFFSAAGDGSVVSWDYDDPSRGRLIAKTGASVYSLLYLPDRACLVVGENYQGLHLISLRDTAELASLRLEGGAIFDLQYHDSRIYAATGDGTVHMVDAARLEPIKKIKLSDKSARCLALNASMGDLAVGLSDNSIRVLGLEDLSPKYLIHAHRLSVFALHYSPDNRFLLSGSRDAQLKVWDCLQHYALHHSVAAHMYAINSIDYAPDGRWFATGSMDKTIKIWDSGEFRLLKVIDRARHGGHGTSVNKVLWAAAGRGLLSCSDDKSILLWRLGFAD